ncbi:thiol:disulfide interchange protein DsbA/DsbL [Sansalvadorimonas verongulae]|uniref:thiol:disulfide interchange protein DsbA/DsbL n=1 Tax=Sansalvadorimonas verongulae TaxID=2172824 RepID=UPI0012BB9D90|nr:thiol:disulfide interchange protein DsbA/DsbL [Sansalvadorimonas verongulae]MTI14952.1 thiol:disulfide interchange protein DsbA/DsbL [Sansalvadorimonas verongulae]
MGKLLSGLFLALITLSVSAAPAGYREGVDFKQLKQSLPVVVTPDKIEIDTVFWYGCSHCFDLARMQENWKEKLGTDVDTSDVPVIFGKPWQAHAQLFYALEDLKLLDKAHFAVFDAVQKQGRRLDNEKDMAAFLKERYGVNEADFERAYDSFGVRNQTQKASAITRGAQLTGVPAIIVNNRYLVDPAMAGGLENMLKVTEYLIEKIRAEKEAAGKAEKLEKAVSTVSVPADG